MKTATVSEIRRELNTLPKDEIVRLCLRLAAFNKENKEFLNYALFEADDEAGFINAVKDEVIVGLAEMNTSSLYLAKKSIRRILRMIRKCVKYSGSGQTEVELLIFFCEAIREVQLPLHKSKVLVNLYQRQLENINKALATLHEDLRSDYAEKIAMLKEGLANQHG